MVCPRAIGEKGQDNKKTKVDDITLSRLREKSPQDLQEGTRLLAEAGTRLVPLAGGWVGGGCPSFLSPQMGAHNKEVHPTTVKKMTGRW